ncbi:protein SPEAR3 [Euphorbia lathyris]|uniref:protein SPEAR3 n=1 Tax=Euphorbia lathyris TaxID=212925 RepID=UPI003313C121
MSSSYHGEANMERGSGSSRKGKKSNSDKPKQPQRGLGVAQLEKIRLHGQLANNTTTANYHHHHHPNFNQEDHMRMQTAYSSLPSSSFSYTSSSMASSASYGFSPNIMMGHEGTNITYGDCQPSTTASWINPGNSFLEAQYFGQPAGATRHLLNLQLEETQPRKSKKTRSNSMGSSSQNSESSDSQELDLELRLSI